jgi:hypothetical protein
MGERVILCEAAITQARGLVEGAGGLSGRGPTRRGLDGDGFGLKPTRPICHRRTMVNAGHQSPRITGHVVLLPSDTPHRTLRLATDVDLLLADTAASVRMNRPLVVFVPPASLTACRRCQEAYAQARKVIEDAGGIAKWMEWVAP